MRLLDPTYGGVGLWTINNNIYLSEGLSLFTPLAGTTEEVNGEGYNDTQRQELKNIVKRKIKKTIQNALPKHAKPNKRFRRFAKKLL